MAATRRVQNTRTSKSRSSAKKAPPRKLDARPDTVDFRDGLFVPTLVEVPVARPLKDYLQTYRRRTGTNVPILNQGREGACTGFGLAAVCNYLLGTRTFGARREQVSPRMLYEMAKRYDEWRGDDYDGSSARGAMKGWHKHGVCAEKLWPYTETSDVGGINDKRAKDAVNRPLGAYFRVNHRDIVAMHAALAEVGILYVTATVHSGWDEVDRKTGIIRYRRGITGGHAFAIVGFDADGFWIQNSWGPSWGRGGFAQVSYEDWLANGFDCWVARLGAPICLDRSMVLGGNQGGMQTAPASFPDLRGHIVSIGNDGGLRTKGTYATSEADVREIFNTIIPRVTAGWTKKRVLIYAHGGLVPEDNAIQRVQDYLKPLLEAEVYPIAFIWKTDFWTTLKNILDDCVKERRPDEPVSSSKDFLLDRFDDTLERLTRLLQGHRLWTEMKENAAFASMRANGGARLVAECLAAAAKEQSLELHAAGHSAGAIFLAPFVQLLTSSGVIPPDSLRDETGFSWPDVKGLRGSLKTCSLWAPACTTGLFKATFLPAMASGRIGLQTLFNLSDPTERDDHCSEVYHKSLLYLVSNAFEKRPRKFFERDGWPILGMDKFIQQDAQLRKLLETGAMDYVLAPNALPEGDARASGSTEHGQFDDDRATVLATFARILGRQTPATGTMSFSRSARSTSERRKTLFRQADRR